MAPIVSEAPVVGPKDVTFALETDDAPEFWQFLNGLAGDDLLIELIVNDLDAGATRTEISFHPDRLVCTGNGRAVDEDGWKRLRLLRGAGRKAPAKKGLFGVKNHGLKACFTIGDDIVVRSAGQQILQTLFAQGKDQPAYPGVRRLPIADPGAPAEGASIEVYYRRAPFRAPDGEPFEFPAATDEVLQATFLEGVRDFPRRLLGVIRPVVLEGYVLRLSHHRLGTATLTFKCGRWSVEKGVLQFSRSCEVLADEGLPGASTYERAFAKASDLGREEDHAAFFRASSYRGHDAKAPLGKAGLVLEVACATSEKGKPLPTLGKLRYPVSYYGDGAGATSGFAFCYSAPFRSDAERHELGAQSKAWNDQLIGACDELVASALSRHLLPRYGPDALKLVAEGSSNERLEAIVGTLLRERALPVVDRDGKATGHKKGKRLAVPVYVAATSTWSKKLARVCPVGTAVLDPRTPARIVGLLGDKHLPSWGEDHLRFDEDDVLDRLRKHDAKFFPWASDSDWRRSLADPTLAYAQLDALQPALAAADPAKRAPATGVHLPDTSGVLHAFEQLKRGVSLPAGLLDVDPPPSLHPKLKDHPVFRLQGWVPEPFGFSDLLASGAIEDLSLAARRRFLAWLAANPGEPGRDDWTALKSLPIWAATSGQLVPLDQLCKPRDSAVAAILSENLLRPVRDVLRICKAVDSQRVRLRVREEPSPEEVEAHYRARLGTFDQVDALTPVERIRFHAFENELLAFGHEGRLAAALRRLAGEARALDQEGRLRPLGDLVRSTPDIQKLALPPDHLLDRPALALDRVLPPLAGPSWQVVATALRRDPGNSEALLPRLRAIARATADRASRRSVEDVPCIPHAGALLAPRDLAFKGNAGDYWGRWKTVISGKSLPDDVQDLYRDAGVIRSFPEPRTSRAFFEWLSSQAPAVVAEHVPQVIRHIAHGRAVTSWWLTPPEVAAIPVEDGGGAALLTVSQAVKRAVVDDFPQLADELRNAGANPPVLLAIDAAKTSTTPVADELKAIGIPGLRATATGPHGMRCDQEVTAPPQLGRLLAALKSDTTAKQLRKQLKEFDVRGDLLEPRWQNKLAAIVRVRVGAGLRAEYRIRRRSYYSRSAWAVAADAGEFWLEDGQDLESAFFGAVADLIFTEKHRYLPLVLRAAIEVRVHEFHQPHHASEVDPDEDPDNAAIGGDDDPAESTHRHPDAEPDLSKNKPSPGPLWTGGTGKVRPRSKPSSPPRPQVIDEDVQRRQLKEDHYAWHCQIALAAAGPTELSPAGSYAEFQENRQKMVEAHHPDKVIAGGARNAGNLLILSHLNHDRYGRAISRQQVTDALLATCEPRTILGADGKPWVKGVVAKVSIPATGDVVPIFFTHDHRSYWLGMAGHAAGPTA